MSRQAIIALDEGGMTSGVVDNIIEITADAAIGLQLPDNHILWACDNYPVAIGDEWNDGVFTREGEPVYPIPTVEQQIEVLDSQLTDTQLALCEQYEENLLLQSELTDTQLALCEQYEENLRLQEEVTNTQLALCELYEASL